MSDDDKKDFWNCKKAIIVKEKKGKETRYELVPMTKEETERDLAKIEYMGSPEGIAKRRAKMRRHSLKLIDKLFGKNNYFGYMVKQKLENKFQVQ